MQLGPHVSGRDSILTKYLTEPVHQLLGFNFEELYVRLKEIFRSAIYSNNVSEVVLRIFSGSWLVKL